MKKFALAAIAAAIVSTPAFAANSDTQTGSAQATVVAPIVLTHTPNAVLNFGKFTAGAGSVVVAADGTATAGGAVVLMVNTVNSADAFSVSGDANRSYAITTTGGTFGTGLTFTTTPSVSSSLLDGTGADTFTVGGTLTVTAAAAAGVHNTTYNATVTYN
jgi:hypothetical protein